jgi:hypothetical protein
MARRPPRSALLLRCGVAMVGLLSTTVLARAASPLETDYATVVRPALQKYCLGCHSTKLKKGSLDLERFVSIDVGRKDLKAWQQTQEMLEAGEMPPAGKPQPTAGERQAVLAWVRGFLDAEARARAGDPGHIPLRRLSNSEYDRTVHDLTGIDLRPAREFPTDGAAGEGFTNAAEALTDISPALLTKYLNAAKEIADHAVLLPDGFRFSAGKTRREWINESVAGLRRFYASFTPDGRLPLRPYLAATVRHRDAVMNGKIALDEVARNEKLNRQYLGILWQSLTGSTPSQPFDSIRERWRRASAKDVDALVAEIAAWQDTLWQFVPIGSYRYGNTVRQVSNDPAWAESLAVNLSVQPAPGQSDVVLYLTARNLLPGRSDGTALWRRPRLEKPGQTPLLLRDYATFGPAAEFDYPAVFGDTTKYLAAALDGVAHSDLSVSELAAKHQIEAAFLKRWIDVLALSAGNNKSRGGRVVATVPLTLLKEKTARIDGRPAIGGWRKEGTDLPVLLTNASDRTEHIPGTVPAHGVAVHPMPQEFVAATWKSPLTGRVRIAAKVTHAHPACGNGVTWRIEHRHADRAVVLAEGNVDLGKEASVSVDSVSVASGDIVLLAIDARDGNHVCDLTDIALTISDADRADRTWDLAGDVADTILDGNPHADRHGNAETWSFVRGASTPETSSAVGPVVTPASSLGRWRAAALDPARRDETTKLAAEVQKLLTGPRPAASHPDHGLYDHLVYFDGPLLRGLDLARFGRAKTNRGRRGLPQTGFRNNGEDFAAPLNSVVELRLPAALFRDRSFVAEGAAPDGSALLFQVSTNPPGDRRWDGKTAVVATPDAYKQLLRGYAEFRRVFPRYICFAEVIPTDEAVSLKMFHREDEPLERLFLDAKQKRRIDQLWMLHRFISRQPLAENAYLPQFIGFVTQDQPKELLAYFESQRPTFQKRADDFQKERDTAVPRQLDALIRFAVKSYRRPLGEKESAELFALYQSARQKGVDHEEAFRAVLARVLVAPAFIFKIEQAPSGKEPRPVSDWELATRLSFFVWGTMPDDELRALAAAEKLHEPAVLAEQTRRMLKDEQVRAIAVEFGTQWLHVRGFDGVNEKNEKLFPTFTAELRAAMNEEAVRFFQDLFQNDGTVTQILNSDHTSVNGALARHYGIPGVAGPEWRRVDAVKQFGRGGILGLAAVQAKQSGASRTSPVLRGNWVVETLLGEKLPRPPPDVPKLPEEEAAGDGLTTRQRVEAHAKDAACAVCHVRIDPFGFALERYDAVGRRRDFDSGGHPMDTHARLKDGTEFDGIDGLRTYLLTKKRDVFVRLFCRKLLGYALGRSVTLSDTLLLDEMVSELQKNDGRLSAAVLAIVRSPQFRMIRGRDFVE